MDAHAWVLVVLSISTVALQGCSSSGTESDTDDQTETSGAATATGSSTTGGGPGGTSGGSGSTGGTDGSGGNVDSSGGGSEGGDSSGGIELDCGDATVLCVDDDPGELQEYEIIQDAVDDAGAGDTVLVHPGIYDGFRVEQGGSEDAPLAIRASGDVDLVGAEPGGTNNVVRLQATSYVVVDGFRIVRDGSAMAYDYDNACVAARGATVETPMHGLTIRNMEVAGCSPAGMYFSQTEGLSLVGNFIHDNVQEDEGGNGQAIYLSNAATDNVVVRHNRLVDNAGPGIHMNGDSSIGGDGVQTGHLFESNFVVGNGQNGFNMDGIQQALLVNNVFASNARHGVRGFRIDASEGPADMIFVNNTFVQNGDTAVRFTDDVGGHVLFNNLVVDNNENVFDIAESTPELAANAFLGDATGVFLDLGQRDFRITQESGAVDQGEAQLDGTDAPADDYNGVTRDGAPDLGAFELGSEPAP